MLNVTPIAADVPAFVGQLKEWIGDDLAPLDTLDPCTGEVLAHLPEHGPADVAKAVALSRDGSAPGVPWASISASTTCWRCGTC